MFSERERMIKRKENLIGVFGYTFGVTFAVFNLWFVFGVLDFQESLGVKITLLVLNTMIGLFGAVAGLDFYAHWREKVYMDYEHHLTLWMIICFPVALYVSEFLFYNTSIATLIYETPTPKSNEMVTVIVILALTYLALLLVVQLCLLGNMIISDIKDKIERKVPLTNEETEVKCEGTLDLELATDIESFLNKLNALKDYPGSETYTFRRKVDELREVFSLCKDIHLVSTDSVVQGAREIILEMEAEVDRLIIAEEEKTIKKAERLLQLIKE